MAEIFNEQRKLGIVIVADGTTMYNGLPVIGLREVAEGVLFASNLRTLGVQVMTGGETIWNDQPVRGAVMIDDARTIYNGRLVIPSNGGYEPEAIALFARMSVQPDAAHKRAYSDFYKTGKAGGWLAKMDCLYLLATHDAQAARLNIAQNAFNLTANGGVTFAADAGYTGDGATGYLDSGFNPTSAVGRKIGTNSAHMGAWSLTATNSSADVGNLGTAAIRFNGGSVRAVTTSNLTGAAAYPGHAAWSRTGANAWDFYSAGVDAGGGTDAAVALSPTNLWVCGSATATYSTNQIAAAHWGSGLAAQEVASLYGALETFLS